MSLVSKASLVKAQVTSPESVSLRGRSLAKTPEKLTKTLFELLKKEKVDIKEVEKLIKIGADVNKKDKYGKTLLHFAAVMGHKEVVKKLIKAGANVDDEFAGGITSLHLAARNGYKEIVEMLIRADADVNKEFAGGRTPLHLAAGKGHEEIVEKLIEARADFNRADEYGMTPRYWAVLEERTKTVALLEAYGAE